MRRPCHAVPCRLDQLLPESHLFRKVPHWKRRMISMLKLRNSSVYPLLCCVVSNMWWYSPMTNNNRGWHWWAHYYPGIGDSYVGSLWYRHHTAHRGYSEIFNYTWGCEDTGAHDWWHMSWIATLKQNPCSMYPYLTSYSYENPIRQSHFYK